MQNFNNNYHQNIYTTATRTHNRRLIPSPGARHQVLNRRSPSPRGVNLKKLHSYPNNHPGGIGTINFQNRVQLNRGGTFPNYVPYQNQPYQNSNNVLNRKYYLSSKNNLNLAPTQSNTLKPNSVKLLTPVKRSKSTRKLRKNSSQNLRYRSTSRRRLEINNRQKRHPSRNKKIEPVKKKLIPNLVKKEINKELVHVDWNEMDASEFFGEKEDKSQKLNFKPLTNYYTTQRSRSRSRNREKITTGTPPVDYNHNEKEKIIKSKNFPSEKILQSSIVTMSTEAHTKRPRTKVDDLDHLLDQKGDNRKWENWVIPSFTPKKSIIAPSLQAIIQPDSYIKSSVSFMAQSQKYKNLIQKYSEHGTKFIDLKFPPRFESLWGFGENKNIPKDYFLHMEWKRPEEIFSENFHVFEGKINPNDVKQGLLGDCYFLASASAIAEHENRIKKLFLSRTITKTGCYCVALCINGIWEDIIVDDFFPCRLNSNSPAFNHTIHNEIWAMLLEKAWAKAHGGYMNIDSGVIGEALRDLSGAPCKSYVSGNESFEVHWQRVLKAEKNDWVMCAASGDIAQMGGDEKDEKTGLNGNHAYALLAAYEIDVSGELPQLVSQPGNEENEKIVKLRNPWAKGEWAGAWNDNDPKKWDLRMKKLLNHESADDGVFFMPFKDFLKYFPDYQICYYHDDYIYSAQRYKTSSTKPTLVEFEIDTSGEYYFTINQINSRFFRKKDSKNLILFKTTKNMLTVLLL